MKNITQNEKSSNMILRGCVLAIIAGASLFVIALVITGIIAYFRSPKTNARVSSQFGLVMVNITQPLNNATFALNKPVAVYAEAYSEQAMQEIQLYIDGEPLSYVPSAAPSGSNKIISSWTWTPVRKGTHTLFARGISQGGQIGVSKAVNINALPPEAIPTKLPLTMTVEPVSTPDATQESILLAEVEGGMDVPPPPGLDEQGFPVMPPPPPDDEPIPPAPQEPPKQPDDNSLPIWIGDFLQNIFVVEPPAAPQLDGGASQCDGILLVKDNADNELGYDLYRLKAGEIAFKHLATLDGKVGKDVFSYHDPGLAIGDYIYYLVAFNAIAEAPSNIISVHITEQKCAIAEPQVFDPQSIPIDANQPVDKAYCYGSAGGMPWVRLPSAQGTFIDPINGKFDLAPYWNLIPLPKPIPDKITLFMECWGWSGDALVYLGASSKSFILPKLGDPTAAPGEPTATLAVKVGISDKLASPYNAHLSNDPQDCKIHVHHANAAENEKKCTQFLKAIGSYILVWDWSQYGACDPASEKCNMDFKPIDGYHVYAANSNYPSVYLINSGEPPWIQTYFPIQLLGKNEFYIRAFNIDYGESADSNHVSVKDILQEITLDPASVFRYDHVVIQRTPRPGDFVVLPPYENKWKEEQRSDNTLGGGYWFNNTDNAGYTIHDVWWNGYVQFNFPDDIIITDASIRWNWADWGAKGAGINDLNMACKNRLTTEYGGASITMSDIWSDEKNYDITYPVIKAKNSGMKFIRIWYMGPEAKMPSVRPDLCKLIMGDIKLTLHYYK